MPAVPLRIRMTLVCKAANQIGLCSVHYVTAVGTARNVNADNLNALAAALSITYAAPLRACLAQQANFLGIRVRYEGPLAAADFEVKYPSDAGVGTWGTTGILPTQTCGLIGKRAAEAGRRGRGRMYIPFVPEDASSINGLPSSDYLDALAALADVVPTPQVAELDGVDTTLFPCLLGADRTDVPRLIIAAAKRDGFATQRRRGFFGRPNALTL